MRLARILSAYIARQFFAWFCGVFGTMVIVTFLLDWSLILPAGVRLVLLAAGLGGFGVLAFKRIFYPLGVKITGSKRTPGRRRSLSALARTCGSIHGAPTTSNGASVPRPTDSFVASSSPTPA